MALYRGNITPSFLKVYDNEVQHSIISRGSFVVVLGDLRHDTPAPPRLWHTILHNVHFSPPRRLFVMPRFLTFVHTRRISHSFTPVSIFHSLAALEGWDGAKQRFNHEFIIDSFCYQGNFFHKLWRQEFSFALRVSGKFLLSALRQQQHFHFLFRNIFFTAFYHNAQISTILVTSNIFHSLAYHNALIPLRQRCDPLPCNEVPYSTLLRWYNHTLLYKGSC